ncbi:glycosyl hydrolase 115 family protein [Belliella sp. DSM 111904]|uniref:Glycosyl hydrolase 115 family protein n=1 Tax=Belliella filtrata TaxID=2923435 RepID=A0ABS9V3M0_9BACT|nr:glycosyl hydrolase 115 family protein [Belliella filtrata]MCH7411012.1 glycosyl hydrolase 115 family protein [Belliella filtrata]
MIRKSIIVSLLLLPKLLFSQVDVKFEVSDVSQYFEIVSKKEAAKIIFDGNENVLLKKASKFLSEDIERVAGVLPEVTAIESTSDIEKIRAKNVIIIGTAENSALIKALIKEGKIKTEGLEGQWEQFRMQSVENPFTGIDQALVIVGSDRRGAAYGVFTLSEKIGVSPWYWWSDVPVVTQDEIYVEKVDFLSSSPKVKYRGIFINDESPAFRNWAFEKFGGINHQCYEKVFELLLRNKANFLWPSMWLPTMFYVDDSLNPQTADDYGIVMSTSHHEPMTRAHQEWEEFGEGDWNYVTNSERLKEFWKGGLERVGDFETMVTVGMRGDGDDAMSEDTAVDLLETIIKDQRAIIEEVTQKPANQTPQVWAIYKEVQDYFDKGMRVDDDITVLFSDDNWGNIRYLPRKESADKKSKYGMYYHFDYVGAPTSYRWQNVTQIERVWEQMKLTYEHGVDEIWIANVGDIKPMELPISFFLDLAWDPDAIQASDLSAYYENWASQQFGAEQAEEIAQLLAFYTKYNSRRTPEMLTASTYSVENYREADRIVNEFNELLERSNAVYDKLSSEYHSAYFQLVHSPIEMCANLNEMYVAAGKNRYYGIRGAAATNYYAEKTKEHFENDARLTQKYHEIENGKWNHMMSQTYIGYTYWNHPPLNLMPPVSYVQLQEGEVLGYLIENGRAPRWGWLDVEADWDFSKEMPVFDPINDQNYYIDIINRGGDELAFKLESNEDWIILSSNSGVTQYHEMVYVTIDWDLAPEGKAEGEIVLSGAGEKYLIKVPINNLKIEATGFVENEGVIAIEAHNFSRKSDSENAKLTVVPNLGRTGTSIVLEPMDLERLKNLESAPHVAYDFTSFGSGDFNVEVHVSPTQDFKREGGLMYAIAIDDEEPQLINTNKGEEVPDYKYAEWWLKSVGDNIKKINSKHKVRVAGKHTLKLWLVDPGVVVQRIVINTGRPKPSYLGPVESKFIAP